ncbi:MAG: DnaA/Hda family protein [Gemmataceae bacterium]
MSPSPEPWPGFVTVNENGYAVQAVRRIVRASLTQSRLPFDLLVLHGQTGSGKSHLVSLAASKIDNSLILPATDFARSEQTDDSTYVPFDLLVVEDLQHLKPQFSDRLTWLIDQRSAQRRFTIVTSTESPADLTTLPHRLRSRLIGGLVLHLGPLSIPSRVKLVRHFARDRGAKIDGEDAIRIAEKTHGGIRPLIGAVENWILDQRSLRGGGLPGIAQEVTREEIPLHPGEHSLQAVSELVAREFGVDVEAIRGPSQLKTHATARQVVILIGRDVCNLTIKSIATFLNRSEATVFGAGQSIRWKMAGDSQLTVKVNSLLDECRELIRKLVAHVARD